MPPNLNILMAQINPTVGDIRSNAKIMSEIIYNFQDSHSLIIFPELALSGYPPEDLLFRKSFHDEIEAALHDLSATVKDCHVIIGHPSLIQGKCYNSASVYCQNTRVALYHKQALPDYGVFDETRYFTQGEARPCIFNINGWKLGLCICEDIWIEEPARQIISAGAEVLLCINASPFEHEKYQQREQLLRAHALKGLTVIYVNLVGGQDELVFDGQSLAMDKTGQIGARAPAFQPALQTVCVSHEGVSGDLSPQVAKEQIIYEALMCGTRDYVEKNGFPGVLLGLSGGIDSALTLAVAVDALGSSRVHAVLMPSRYTAEISLHDARQQAAAMQVNHTEMAIEPVFQAFLKTLQPSFTDLPQDITEENLQARIRGMLLMALSNKTGNMVLTTSNKSEAAVGYATLYGDMAGGFAVLKDILKTQVYALARYRNSLSRVIPQRVLDRPPSAELAANQTDQDSLPDYAILDAIIIRHVEQNLSAAEIIAQGFPAEAVHQVLKLIKRSEYKRRQAAPGIKISSRAFDRDWRFPITSGYREP